MAELGNARVRGRQSGRKYWLMGEAILLYAVGPLIMALAVPARFLFPVLFAITIIGLVLLHRTPGFRWAELWQGIGRVRWEVVAAGLAATLAVAWAAVRATSPTSVFFLPLNAPQLMLAIALLYPFLSALPQEIVFRPLFFRRYGDFLPSDPRHAVLLNAGAFSFAHLMYWSWTVAAMTFAGGLVFAWSYRVRNNFPEAVILHALAGVVLFAVGMGAFFYTGNIQRPF